MAEKMQPGNKIRITEDDLLGARVGAGDVLEVTDRVNDTVFIVESPRAPWASGWWIPDGREGKGWERVESGS